MESSSTSLPVVALPFVKVTVAVVAEPNSKTAPESILITKSHLLSVWIAVALNVRQTVGTGGVGPPIPAVADVIVGVAAGRRPLLIYNCDDGTSKSFAGLTGNV